MNPFTPLTLAACGVVLVLTANSPWVSVGAVGCAGLVVLATSWGRHAGRPPNSAPNTTNGGDTRAQARSTQRAFLAALALAVPSFVGFSLMYGPFGQETGWWIFTRDGMEIALELTLRIIAAACVGLVFGSLVNVDALMRALQTRIPARLVYVIGSTVRLLPMARARVRDIRRVYLTRGVDLRGIRGRLALVMPVIVGLVLSLIHI